MSLNAAALPQEILCSVFLYLGPKDLCKVAQVCRSWNAAQKTDGLWRNLCLSILDLQRPFQGSWKEQYRILYRWKTGGLREVYLPTILNIFHESGDFTVLEDDTIIGVFPPSRACPLLYSVRNLASGEELGTIDLKQWGCGKIVDGDLHGTTWTIVDWRARVFQFNISTGACVNRFAGAFEPGREPCLHCNDQEVVLAVGNRVQVWDVQRCTLEYAFEIDLILGVTFIRVTPNHVICFCKIRSSGSEIILAVNKKDPSRQIKIEGNAEPNSLDSCGAYFSFLTKEGDLKMYEDTPDAQIKLNRTVRVVEAPTPWPGAIQMYRNWVAVSKNEIFRVFDVRTGYEVSLPVKEKGYEFRMNAQMVLFRRTVAEPYRVWTTTYCMYDFGHTVRQLSMSEGVRDQESVSGCCLVM